MSLLFFSSNNCISSYYYNFCVKVIQVNLSYISESIDEVSERKRLNNKNNGPFTAKSNLTELDIKQITIVTNLAKTL
jgi:hypothetical protein